MFNIIFQSLNGTKPEADEAAVNKKKIASEQPAGGLDEQGIVQKKHDIVGPDPKDDTKENFDQNDIEDEEWIFIDAKDATFDVEDEVNLSDTSPLPLSPCRLSARSTPTLGWNLIPPACFENQPIDIGYDTRVVNYSGILETSNFENLLIEHPSMSVYHHRADSPHEPLRPSLATADGVSRRREISLLDFFPLSFREHLAGIPHANQRQAQKAEKASTKSSLSMRKLERSNRCLQKESAPRRSSSRSKKLKAQVNSGRNNDRKCQ